MTVAYMRAGFLSLGLGLTVLLSSALLSGCSARAGGTAEPTTTVTKFVTTGPSSPPQDSRQPTPGISSEPPTPGSDETASTQVLPPESRGRELGLDDMFFAGEEWREDRFDIANQSQVRGLGAEVGCNNAPVVLELRLARQFDNLTMNVGQSNDSSSSDGAIIVELLGNGEQVDIREVPFDRIQPFDVSIDSVNALKIQVSFEQERCNSGRDTAVAVISGLTVT